MSDANSLVMAGPSAPSSSRLLKPTNTKPGPVSDTESSPSESESEASQPAKAWQGREAPSPAESMPSSVMTLNKGADGAASDTPVIPTQKRRRVTRACDECRRKKIKCDGKQPCTHCQVYSYECTYDKPSNRRRNPAPQYIEALEDRLHKAETLLRKFMPDLDLADPNLDPAVQQEFRNRERARALATGTRKGDLKEIASPDAQILSMIETIGQIDLDEKGAWDFHGISSGAVFLRKIQEHFPPGLLTPKQFNKPFLQQLPKPPGVYNLDSPESSMNSPWSSPMSAAYVLPPRENVDHLCYLALHCATCLIRIVHVPSFNAMVDRLYEIPPETYDEKDTRSLGLLYAVMALGCMYDVPQDLEPLDATSYKSTTEQGAKYYTTARLIFRDITDCADLTTLQAILFMTLFLQGTSNLAGCYSFLGIAFRSAIRMGMHRHVTHPQMNKIEDEVRRRLWFIIRQMDTYVSAILGFPMMAVDDVDQRFPTEVDDQYITDTEIQSVQLGTPSFFQAFNAHTKLMEILAKIVKYVYPLKGVEECVLKAGQLNAAYMISYKKILDIEAELQNWLENLPDAWKPSNEGDPEVVRVRHLLRFAYAHVQMMLYRPFIHYSSPRLSQSKSVDQRAFHCAASAISVSRNIVHIWTEIRKQGVLIGPYWFILYTELFAILSLVFYVLENPDKPGSDEILADATVGRDMIAKISQTSQAAEKVTMLLSALFEKLPEKLKKAKGRPIPSKKRTAPTQKDTPSKHPQPSQPAAQTPQRKASGELARANGRRSPSKATQNIPHRSSVDSVHSSNHALSSNIQDMVFDNMSNSASDSTTVTPPGTVYQQPQNFISPGQHGGDDNSSSGIYNDMFSSSDPFAYPNQPLIELADQQPRSHSGNHGPQRQGSGMFGVPNMFDDIEGQLVHIPTYLMETQNGQPQVDLTAQMYESTGMLTLEQIQAHAQQHHHLRQQHQQHQPHHQVHHQQHQCNMDGMYHGGGIMNANWNPNFFQSPNFRG